MTQPAPGPAPCYRHPDRPTYVRCVRCDRPICPDCMRPASVGFQCPEEGSAPPVRTVRTVRDSSSFLALARTAPVTSALVVANVLVFLGLVLDGSGFASSVGSKLHAELAQSSVASGFVDHGQVVALAGIADGRPWQLLTAMFVHYGIVHIGLNMLSLFFIGVPLERQLGRTRYLAVYLVAGLGGGVATYLFADPTGQSAGASGAIFGLLGAYAVVSRRLPTAQLGSVTGVIVINLVFSFAVPGISVTDHIGGLVVGAILGAALALDARVLVRTSARARRLLVEIGAFVVVLLVLGGLFAVRTHELRDRYHLQGPIVSAQRPPAAPSAAAPPRVG